MKPIAVAFVLFLISAAARGQHSLAMHSHSGTGSASACVAGRFDVPIKPHPPELAGDLHHELRTSPLAQRLFDQGLTFFYGFDSESALRMFHQATVEDPNLAMGYWGVALAAGGDLNIPIDDPCICLAVGQIQMAIQHLDRATDAEKLYINALAQRYPKSCKAGSGDLQQLSVNYMLAMRSVYERIGSKDPEAGALYAYSLMNLRPWLWWTTSGQPSDEIKETLQVLDDSLKPFPRHIGLNHLKVHAWEEAPIDRAEKARPAAEVLVEKAPFITPHLRHMPAHTYLLLGEWDKVVKANQRATEADQPWAEKCPERCAEACQSRCPAACNQLLVGHYYSHDMLFLDVGYNNQGKWEEVKPLAEKLEANAREFICSQPGLEHYLTTRVAMTVHFGKWAELAALDPPQKVMPNPKDNNFCARLDHKLAAAMWYFGQGMADASLGRPTDGDLFGFQQAQGCVQSAGIGWGNNSASAILQVLRWRLLERIARQRGMKEASKTFALLAVETEDLLNYDEPPGWYLSSRETYGASLYLNGEFKKAADVFREDLRRHPNNSRSLFGLWQALAEQHSPEAALVKERFERNWSGKELPKLQDM